MPELKLIDLILRLIDGARHLLAAGANPDEIQVVRVQTSEGPKGRAEQAWDAELAKKFPGSGDSRS